MPKVSLLLFCLGRAQDHEVRAWQSLRTVTQDVDTMMVEVDDDHALEREHARLLAEGWQLESVGIGSFQHVMVYGRE